MDAKQSVITNHPDYEREDKRLQSTIKAMQEAVPDLANSGYQVKAWDTEVDIRSKHMVAAYKRKKALALSENLGSPYFGRVDYLEDGFYAPEQLYVGRAGFSGPEEVQVVDWRAPKATVFYECQGGRANYTVRDETYYGEVSLKRQYQISNGVLENFFDDQVIDSLTAGLHGGGVDQVLRQRLEQSTDNRLKDIVETIRSEQNKIIREPLEQVTIVQGTAGSGKSSVALHRVSYLLYNHQSLEARKVAVIAPNRLFIDYISAVLPGLDLQGIQQFTLPDLAESLLNCSLALVEACAGPGPQSCSDTLARLQDMIEQTGRQFVNSLQDISLYQGRLVVSREELANKFREGNNPLNRRLDSLKKYLEFRITYFLQTSDLYFDQKIPPGTSKALIKGYLQRIKDNYELEMFKTEPGQARSAKTVRNQALKHKLEAELAAAEAEKAAFLRAFGRALPYMDVWQAYSMFKGEQVEGAPGEQPVHSVHRQDLAPLCLLKLFLDGFAGKYQHIVVDEAQDLSPLEFATLKLLCRNSFTILGDLAQGIAATTGLEDWQVLQQQVFTGLPLKYYELKQSYRSTKQIVEFANGVLPPELPRGIPVYRQGDLPRVEGTASMAATAGRVQERVEFYLQQGCKSVAIIVKTAAEANQAYSLLEQAGRPGEFTLISENSASLPAGVTVLTIALAKGLEFDAVIVWNASAERFKALPLDAKQLFVALSRPLHYLHVFYTGELTPLLQHAAGETLTVDAPVA